MAMEGARNIRISCVGVGFESIFSYSYLLLPALAPSLKLIQRLPDYTNICTDGILVTRPD